jgi:N-glycosylase/DNA lyase
MAQRRSQSAVRQHPNHDWTRTILTPAPGGFDLALTLNSGQAFHWIPEDGGFLGCINQLPFFVHQVGGHLELFTRAEDGPAAVDAARIYFALDHDLDKIRSSFPSDPVISAALEFSSGMRILRQPPWECLATFITSALKQVTQIAAISRTLRHRYGQRHVCPRGELFSYPTPETIAALSEADLRDCALGFRAKNLLGAARAISEGRLELNALCALATNEARDALCTLPGVGPKIANCALLFAYGRLEAIPIDVWIERVLRRTYFRGKRNVTAQRLREFSASYFGPYGGYLQQALFHHARLTRGALLT